MQVPAFGKIVLKNLKKNAFAAFQVQLEHALEKQQTVLQAKFARMENTEIGSKIGVHSGTNLENVPFIFHLAFVLYFDNEHLLQE